MDFNKIVSDFARTVERMYSTLLAGIVASVIGIAVLGLVDYAIETEGGDPDLVFTVYGLLAVLGVGLARKIYWPRPQGHAVVQLWVRGINTLVTAVGVMVGLTLGAIFTLPLVQPRPHSHGWPRRSECRSNLRQLLLGVKQYIQDYDNKFPLQTSGAALAGGQSGYVANLWPYVGNSSSFLCPLAPANGAAGKTSYAYNTTASAASTADFVNAGNTVIFCECPLLNGNQAVASAPWVLDRHLGMDTYWFAPWIVDRRKAGSNYAFVDGHVKWIQSFTPVEPASVAATASFTFGR